MKFLVNPFTGRHDRVGLEEADGDARYITVDQTSIQQTVLGELKAGQFYATGYGTYNFYGAGQSYFAGGLYSGYAGITGFAELGNSNYAAYFSDPSNTVYLCDGNGAATFNGNVLQSTGHTTLGYNSDLGYQLGVLGVLYFADSDAPTYSATFNSGNALYLTDGNSGVTICDGTYSLSTSGPSFFYNTTNNSLAALITQDGSGGYNCNFSFNDGATPYAASFIDASANFVLLCNGTYAINATGSGYFSGNLDVRGSAVFNEDGGNNDFRVEGDTDVNNLFVDASADTVFMGTNALPAALKAKLVVKLTHDGATNYESAIDAMNDVLLTQARTGNYQYGLNFTVQKRGNYNFGRQWGIVSTPYQFGTGTTTETVAVLANGVSFRGAGADGLVSNASCLKTSSPSQISGALGTITNMYGLYLDEMKKTFVTNGYSIYQTGSSDLNYFAGQLIPDKRTVLLPSYSFNGDQNTGIWSAGADLIDFACAGVNLFEMTTAFSEPVLASKTSTAINLQANGGQNIFRGLDNWTGTWADSVSTSYFQVGRANPNTMFSGYTGTPFNRLSFTVATGTGKGLVIDTNTSGYAVPAAYFDIRIAGVSMLSVAYTTGNIGAGTQAASAKIHAIKTTEQLRLGYDTSNYTSFTVGSANAVTIANAVAADININCGTDKTVVLTESVWDDIQFPVSGAKVPAANYPTWETFTTNTNEYSFAVNDYIDASANEPPHGWKEGTSGSVHLHLAIKTLQNSGADRFAKFTVYVTSATVGAVFAETSVTAEYTIPNNTAALTHYLLSLGTVTFTNYLIGSQIKVRIKRIAATGGTEYASNVFVTQCGIHVEQDTVGSRQIATK